MQRQPGKSAALYARAATRETSGQHLDNQMQRLLCYAQDNSLDIFMLYEDCDTSGLAPESPTLSSLRADIKAGYVDEIIVTDLAQIGHSFVSGLGFIEWAQGCGISIIGIDEGCRLFPLEERGDAL